MENNKTREEILSAYMNQLLEKGSRPASVYAFARDLEIDEAEFYKHFGSFEALEKAVFKAFFDQSMQLLEQNKEYNHFDAKNKLIAFYYTFFEVLKANRSYVLLALNDKKDKLKVLASLSELKKAFAEYIDGLEIETPELPHEKIEKIKTRSLRESAWAQLLFTLRFWIEDTSPEFEKTDVFIEKSVNTAFALLDATTLNSVFDLGKFLYHEKIMSN
ncbi:TetR family transcriptional regulator C-terminal domain-containing protein [uncultured Draconibacterium sp.]|uniref:TetR/AcrR family transcriptional regulator n=1 Tax=uncultured Draconibacterium sp. TaxID=1573823 RepID=UPI002605883F|nr:TetR family transcriptional regulator C-terminal domain-containing protein [uncultured Draconibacterium sp.]